MGQGFHGASTFRLNILLGEGGYPMFSIFFLLESDCNLSILGGVWSFTFRIRKVRRGALLVIIISTIWYMHVGESVFEKNWSIDLNTTSLKYIIISAKRDHIWNNKRSYIIYVWGWARDFMGPQLLDSIGGGGYPMFSIFFLLESYCNLLILGGV